MEPPAGPAWARPRLFCVQKHAATRLHYDFRVEIGGVLRSWAVPRGPSLDPSDKRMAVEVEDHPVEYADFEGKIPEGNYGAGEVIVWDKGLWIPLENPEETLPKGKLTFELRGYKLRGAWHLFRTKGKGKDASKEWMLVKRPDGWASATRALPPGVDLLRADARGDPHGEPAVGPGAGGAGAARGSAARGACRRR